MSKGVRERSRLWTRPGPKTGGSTGGSRAKSRQSTSSVLSEVQSANGARSEGKERATDDGWRCAMSHLVSEVERQVEKGRRSSPSSCFFFEIVLPIPVERAVQSEPEPPCASSSSERGSGPTLGLHLAVEGLDVLGRGRALPRDDVLLGVWLSSSQPTTGRWRARDGEAGFTGGHAAVDLLGDGEGEGREREGDEDEGRELRGGQMALVAKQLGREGEGQRDPALNPPCSLACRLESSPPRRVALWPRLRSSPVSAPGLLRALPRLAQLTESFHPSSARRSAGHVAESFDEFNARYMPILLFFFFSSSQETDSRWALSALDTRSSSAPRPTCSRSTGA